jgi:hypothetical protein
MAESNIHFLKPSRLQLLSMKKNQLVFLKPTKVQNGAQQ